MPPLRLVTASPPNPHPRCRASGTCKCAIRGGGRAAAGRPWLCGARAIHGRPLGVPAARNPPAPAAQTRVRAMRTRAAASTSGGGSLTHPPSRQRSRLEHAPRCAPADARSAGRGSGLWQIFQNRDAMGSAAPRPSTRTMVLCTGTRGSLVRCPLRQRRPVRAARAAARAAARSLPDSGRFSARTRANLRRGAGRQLRTQQRASDGFICVTSRDPACRVKQAQPKPETHGRTRSTLMALLTARNSGCVVCRVTYLPFAFSSDLC